MRLKDRVAEKLKTRVSQILVRWRKRQGPFTLKDFYFRDKILLFHLSIFIYGLGITANKITFAGFFLLFLWVPLRVFFTGRLLFWTDLWFITLIELTDFLDGSTARNNDDITVAGTLADYFRDLLFLVVAAWATLNYGAPWYIFWIAVSIKLVSLLIKLGAFVWYGAGPDWREKILDFTIDNFQGSFEHRFHFGLLCFGLPYLILGKFKGVYFFVQLGYALIWTSLVAGAVVIVKELKWAPPLVENQ